MVSGSNRLLGGAAVSRAREGGATGHGSPARMTAPASEGQRERQREEQPAIFQPADSVRSFLFSLFPFFLCFLF